MNSKVRDFFQIETDRILIIDNFDDVYHVFEQLVELDVEVPREEGLRERLPYALEKITCDKIDRNDVITFFPIIWQKFESYVKKLVYLIDRDKFEALSVDHRNGLWQYLGALNYVAPFPDIIQKACKLRNKESHSCESDSLRYCYNSLAYALAAYLYVTRNAIPKLKTLKNQIPDLFKIDLSVVRHYNINTDCSRPFFNRLYRLSDITAHIKRIEHPDYVETYDDTGMLVSTCSKSIEDERGNVSFHRSRYEYKRVTDHLVRCYVISEYSGYTEEKRLLKEFKYDQSNRLVSISFFTSNNRHGTYKSGDFYIEYCPDGSIVTTRINWRPIDKFTKYADHKKIDGELYMSNSTIKEYDKFGLLRTIKDENGKTISRYVYSDEGVLTNIVHAHHHSQRVEIIGNCIYFYEVNPVNDTEKLIQKLIYNEEKLAEIVSFPQDSDGRENSSGYRSIIEYK